MLADLEHVLRAERTDDVRDLGERIEAKPREAREVEVAVAEKCVEIWLTGKEMVPTYKWPRKTGPVTCFACGEPGHIARHCDESSGDDWDDP